MGKSKKETNCSTGNNCNHDFIVSNWSFNSTSQRATGYVCKYCLLHINSDEQVQVYRSQLNAQKDA